MSRSHGRENKMLKRQESLLEDVLVDTKIGLAADPTYHARTGFHEVNPGNLKVAATFLTEKQFKENAAEFPFSPRREGAGSPLKGEINPANEL